MKNTIITAALVAMISSVSFADDYDNTSVTIAAEGPAYGVELSTNDTTRMVSVYNTNGALDLGVQLLDNGTNRDYNVSVSKTIDMPIGSAESTVATVYVSGEAEYNWGDSFTKSELHLTPKVGAKTAIGNFTPFGELGYGMKSLEGDYTDIDRDTPFAEVGSSFKLTDNTSLRASVLQSMDTDWNKTDRELGLKLTVQF
jgi:opacity protein-like surface antigen